MLTATEFHRREPLPLARIHQAIFESCRTRGDLVLFGAQAVNVYVAGARMTRDVGLLADNPEAAARDLARELAKELHMTVRVHEITVG